MSLSFCERLLALRTDLGLTQQQCANGVGIAKARYQHYETGRREPDIEMLIALARFFGVSSDYLIGMSDQK